MTYDFIPGVPAAGHVSRGYWHPGRAEGCVKCEPAKPRIFTINKSDVDRCPRRSLSPYHYNEDGTCKCPPDDRGANA